MQGTFRAFVQQNGTAATLCPVCGRQTALQPSQIKGGGHLLEAQCACGNRFSVVTEFRKAYRRKTNLPGTWTSTSSEEKPREIQIEDLSMTGAGFRGASDHGLSPGTKILLEMTLDDEKNTELKLPATVVHVRGRFAGCAFSELSSFQLDQLASYLMLIP